MKNSPPENDGAIDGLHGLPMLIQIDRDLTTSQGARVGRKLLADMTGAFPNMGVNIDDHAFSS